MFNHNKFANQHHAKIIAKGYWENPKEIGTLLMLVVTEISKLFDVNRVNKSEKLADASLRLYDLLAFYNVDLTELPQVKTCSLHDMISMLTNELEADRVGIQTKKVYLKQCLSMMWLYAKENNIDLEEELLRKSEILMYMGKKKY